MLKKTMLALLSVAVVSIGIAPLTASADDARVKTSSALLSTSVDQSNGAEVQQVRWGGGYRGGWGGGYRGGWGGGWRGGYGGYYAPRYYYPNYYYTTPYYGGYYYY